MHAIGYHSAIKKKKKKLNFALCNDMDGLGRRYAK